MGRVLEPVLEVLYEERALSTLSDSDISDSNTNTNFPMASFSVVHSMEAPGYAQGASIVAALVALTAALAWAYATFLALQRREPHTDRRSVTVDLVVTSALILCKIIGVALAWTLGAGSLYWLLFFKAQTVLFAFLPDPTGTLPRTLLQLLILATVTLAISLAAQLWRQCRSTDVFFMDWERPRGAARDPDGKEKSTRVSVWPVCGERVGAAGGAPAGIGPLGDLFVFAGAAGP